jgi:hypothetical protein
MLVQDLDVRIIHAHRELIRQLIIDSTEDHRVSGDFGGKFVRIGD